MSRSRWTSLTIIIVIVLFGVSRPLAQEKPGSAAQPKLAIEIVDGRKRLPAPVLDPPSEGGFIGMGPTKPLADWKLSKNTIPLTGIRIRSTLEGDAVRIKVAGVFDDTEPVEAPGPKYGPVEKAIGSYLAREGETVNVVALTNLGFEPLVLKIVKAEPLIEDPPLSSEPPQVINNLKSVAVVSLVPETQPSNSYQLTVQNISAKSIVALDVYIPHGSGRQGVTSLGDVTRPVMVPGATTATWMNESRGGRTTVHGFMPAPLSGKIIVGTVVFADETYEGEAERAVEIIGEQKGRRLQLARALPLLQKILESPDQEAVGMLDRLQAEVSGLRIDVDGQTVGGLETRFPELPKSHGRKRLTSILMRGFTQGRHELLSRIKDIENAHKRDPQSESMWQRLSSLKEQLEIRAKENELSR